MVAGNRVPWDAAERGGTVDVLECVLEPDVVRRPTVTRRWAHSPAVVGSKHTGCQPSPSSSLSSFLQFWRQKKTCRCVFQILCKTVSLNNKYPQTKSKYPKTKSNTSIQQKDAPGRFIGGLWKTFPFDEAELTEEKQWKVKRFPGNHVMDSI